MIRATGALEAVALGVILASAPESATSQAISVKNPFLTEVAQKHFAQCFPEFTPTDLKKLANIESFGYADFPAATPCTTPGCNPALKEFTSTRIIRFRANQLNPSAIRSSVYGMEGGDCSYNRIRSFSSQIERNSITFRYTPYHKERACNYGIVIEKGSATADVTTTVVLGEDFSVAPTTIVSNVKTESNFSFGNAFADAVLGGIILGPVGVLIGAVGIPEINKTIISEANFGGKSVDVNFGGTGINLYAYSDVQKRLDKLGLSTPLAPYRTNRDASGFVLDNDSIAVEVRQSAQVLDLMRTDFAQNRKFEIDFLAGLNEYDGKSVVVKPGDNLWKLVKREYLDARLFILVAQANGLKHDDRLKVGSTLTLPRWHEMCKKLGGNPQAVLAGETVWAKAQKGQIPKDLRLVRTYSGKKSLIYPLEVLEVREQARK